MKILEFIHLTNVTIQCAKEVVELFQELLNENDLPIELKNKYGMKSKEIMKKYCENCDKSSQ